MNESESLKELCRQGMVARGLSGEAVEKRLAEELGEVAKAKEEGYFIDLHSRKVKYATNEHNSLIVYLLGIVNDIDLGKEVGYTSPEWP